MAIAALSLLFLLGSSAQGVAAQAQAAQPSRADSDHPAQLTFYWIDGVDLPEPCRSQALEEARRLFSQFGIEVEWATPGAPLHSGNGADVQVFLIDTEPEAWGLQAGTLASAINPLDEDPSPNALFVFVPSLIGSLEACDDPAQAAEAANLGRVLGRLVAQTTVRAAFQEGSTIPAGMFSPEVQIETLLDPRAQLDSEATRALWLALLTR